MRVLIATCTQEVVGGAETYLRALLPRLRARGHEVGLLYEVDGAEGRPWVDALAPDAPRWSTQALGVEGALEGVRRWGPALVYGHALADLGVERRLLETYPVFFFAHAYHGACISSARRFAFPRVQVCERALGPGCLALFLPRRCGGRSPWTMAADYGYQQERRELLKRCRAVLVASRHMQREYVRQGLPAERVALAPLFPTGVAPDPELSPPRPLTGRVLLAGRLIEPKGGHLLVEALARAAGNLGRPLSLVVAGDGPERRRLEVLGRARGLEVEFSGWLDAQRLAALMRQVDLLAVPSLWPEPFGLVGIEAGCVGLPAVGYATGGIPDWLEPGVSGESAPGDVPRVEPLAQAVVRALADPAHHARLRRGAWEVARRFTAEAHLDALERIWAEGLAAGPPPGLRRRGAHGRSGAMLDEAGNP